MNIDTRKIVRIIALIVLIASLCVLAFYIIGDLSDAKTDDDIKISKTRTPRSRYPRCWTNMQVFTPKTRIQ